MSILALYEVTQTKYFSGVVEAKNQEEALEKFRVSEGEFLKDWIGPNATEVVDDPRMADMLEEVAPMFPAATEKALREKAAEFREAREARQEPSLPVEVGAPV